MTHTRETPLRHTHGPVWGSGALAVALVLGVAATAHARAYQRPIEDFIERQGTFGGFANFINWISFDDDGALLRIRVDYAGLLNGFLERRTGGQRSLGTQMSGSVTERPLKDGRTEVHVVLHTENAWTFVRDISAGGPTSRTGPILFGWPVLPVLLFGAQPGLADSVLNVRWITPNPPGAPLDDIFRILWAPEEGEEFVQVLFRAQARGELRGAFGVPDGTPGKVAALQRGIFNASFEGGITDASAFPADYIRLRVMNR